MPTTFERHLKKEANVPIRCPQCMQTTTVGRFFYEHALTDHKLIKRLQCVFCFAKYRWPQGKKCSNRLHEKHLVSCLKRFLEENRIPAEVRRPIELPTVEWDKLCQRFRSIPGDMRGRVKDRLSEYVGLYESVFEKPDMWTREGGVKFNTQSGLGHDVYWMIQRYLDKDLDWYHLMVKHNAFDSFVKGMEFIRDEFVVLPFWCLCDGLEDETGQRKTHRHMIVACQKSPIEGRKSKFLKTLREKVRIDTGAGEASKLCIPIRDVYHLIQTIAYVSGPKATCDRGIPELDDEAERHSHFHVNRPIFNHGKAFLASIVPGGIEWLLYRQNRNKKVIDWADHAVRGGPNKTWRVPIGVTGWPFLDCVIPVDREYEPTTERGDFCLHLFGELHFKRNPDLSSLSEDEWYAHQVRKGNTLQAIKHEMYVLSKTQQYTMSQIKAMEEMTRNSIGCWWNSKYSKLQRERDDLENQLNAERLKCIAIEKERDQLRLKLVELERDTYKTERDALKAKLEEMENKYSELEMRYIELEKSYFELQEKYSDIQRQN